MINWKFKPADIILVHDSRWLIGRAIKWVLNLFQKDEVYFSHALMACDERIGIEAGGFPGEIREIDLLDKLTNCNSYMILRRTDLTDGQRELIVNKARKCLGQSYGYIRLFAQLFDQAFGTNRFTRLTGHCRRHICSTFVSWSYYVICKIEFNALKWFSVEPDDFEDDYLVNTNFYTCSIWRSDI
jgi:hypothetical protein